MRKEDPPNPIDFQDFLALQKVLFDWADSYDTKDWARLRGIVAPYLTVDYTDIGMRKWVHLPADDYIQMVADGDFLGDPSIKTQHLVGATWWEKVSDTEVIGHHQLRAAHQVYTAEDRKVVKLKGHSHATNEHYYHKVEGVWKFAGLKPSVHWNEDRFQDVFRASS